MLLTPMMSFSGRARKQQANLEIQIKSFRVASDRKSPQTMVKNVPHRFDMKQLCDTLDAERSRRGLSWKELTAEINKPFEGTRSIPITVGTIRAMLTRRSVTSAVALQVLRWLRRSPESFLTRPNAVPDREEALPEPGPGRILRFDTRALYAAVNEERNERGLTWKQLTAELPGFTENMLTNLSTGPLIGFPHVMVLTQWVGRPAVSFVRGYSR
jgi:hypothetical protein